MHLMMTIFGDGGGGVSGLMKKEEGFFEKTWNIQRLRCKIPVHRVCYSTRLHLTCPYDDIILI